MNGPARIWMSLREFMQRGQAMPEARTKGGPGLQGFNSYPDAAPQTGLAGIAAGANSFNDNRIRPAAARPQMSPEEAEIRAYFEAIAAEAP